MCARGDQCALEDFDNNLTNENRETQENRCAEITAELAQLQEKEQELADRVSSLRARVETLSHDDELARLQQQAATLEESMQRMAYEWSRRALARGILEAAKNTFERERQPRSFGRPSEISSRITGRDEGHRASFEEQS